MSKTSPEGITVSSAFDYFCERFRLRYLTDLSEINHKGQRNLVLYSCNRCSDETGNKTKIMIFDISIPFSFP